jgi:hypothetical protein
LAVSPATPIIITIWKSSQSTSTTGGKRSQFFQWGPKEKFRGGEFITTFPSASRLILWVETVGIAWPIPNIPQSSRPNHCLLACCLKSLHLLELDKC